MINLRKRMAGPRSTRMLMPAVIFLGFASLSAAGGGAVAALCLVPAGLVADAVRSNARSASTPDTHHQSKI